MPWFYWSQLMLRGIRLGRLEPEERGKQKGEEELDVCKLVET